MNFAKSFTTATLLAVLTSVLSTPAIGVEGTKAKVAKPGLPAVQGSTMKPLKPDNYPNKDTPEAAIYRGSIVYNHYCIRCHGAEADGNGRAAKIYNPKPANLLISPFPDAYKELIIRGGGAGVGRSPFMPPWGDELTNEQIHDVVQFLRSIVQKP